ncbi:CHASE domain-containing protein [Actinoplanes hulinensis]|uniref:CHASE domain-containing protein n=1 Tax=Actinoplanes hulinensis TaxID=1144547 RepID=A0ABS7B3G1_9ACTN|nr:CHASE domain-containing protein [Actinoplanes hulinensis]MBW6435572.1 CHASE domain-containing protein [Actinoplanes hulinensis]
MGKRGDGARRVTSPLLSVSVLLAGLTVTVLSSAALYGAQRDIAGRVMDQRHRTALAAVRAETERFRGLLDSVAAGIATDSHLTWEDFDVATGPLADAGPAGATPVAFLVSVPEDDVAAAQQRWRDHGASGLVLRPNPGNDVHYFRVLSRALGDAGQAGPRPGTDVAGAGPLSTALELARDTHRTTVSDPYVPIHDPDGQPSFAFAAPVWTRANTPEFRGWVVSGLHGGTFLRDVLRAVGDSGISGELVAVDGDGGRDTVASWAGPGEPDLRRSDPFEVGDRQWVLETRGDSRQLAGTGWYLPMTVLTGGLVLTGLLARLAYPRPPFAEPGPRPRRRRPVTAAAVRRAPATGPAGTA